MVPECRAARDSAYRSARSRPPRTRLPCAGADAGRPLASPLTAAVVARQATGASRPLAIGRYADPDGAARSDAAPQVGRPALAQDIAGAELNPTAQRPPRR